MISPLRFAVRAVPIAVLAATALAFSACEDKKASELALTFIGSGKDAKFEVPKSTEGGLVEVSLTNDSKDAASAQLVRFDAGHTAEEALEIVTGEGDKIPDWLHGAGGPGATDPGETSTATVNLVAGDYIVVNDELEEGPRPNASLKVTEGEEGDLPETDASVTARDQGEDGYEFVTEGLEAGDNEITFDNQSENQELHHVIALPLLPGNTAEDVKKALESESGPPPVDEKNVNGTTVIDGGTEMVTQLRLKKGKSVLVCFLPDRAGGKSHFEQGMIEEVDVG